MRKWLAADNGSGGTLAAEYESGVSEVVESVITSNKRLQVWE